ncbi:HAD-IIB family hydrolase [Georgenia sp. SYP-B2076]|uniref:HAD-IIB family hydrolase n=1 Tax=Georgenia sp. SYP-B2076 TaxID=2495881 RepID=UPI00197ADDCE|nr:HAD-IIB family hydrolase [Georgenia sp. SYP-B2076]
MTDRVRLIAFDLDDTLAPSKSPMPAPMGAALTALLDSLPVCIISGGHFGQFRDQVLAHLPASDEQLSRLHLMPTCGTRYLRHENASWRQVYAHDLSDAERRQARAAVESEARRLGFWEERTWGEILEDRGSQITFSALGQEAPLEAKKAWDPTGEKKGALRDAVARLVPDLEVRSGGSTSVDITRAGVDKAYGMTRLSEQTGIDVADMLFVGDRLDEGGNDYPVVRLGMPTYAVEGWEQTVALVEGIVAKLVVAQA